jgi:hypothetical protein
VANSQDGSTSQHPDLLAAVVLDVLVVEGRAGMTVAEVARACERDPAEPIELNEIETALEILIEDELAREGPEHCVRYTPTRAAVRASELSF